MSKALKTGPLSACGCEKARPAAAADGGGLSGAPVPYDLPSAPGVGGDRQLRRPKRRSSKGTGPFCVYSHKGTKVRCYEDKATAERVAAAFSRSGRSRSKFHVGGQ